MKRYATAEINLLQYHHFMLSKQKREKFFIPILDLISQIRNNFHTRLGNNLSEQIQMGDTSLVSWVTVSELYK